MSAAIFARQDGVWLNEPERWTAQGDSLEIVTDKATDFWQKTHYGFSRDSGHFLGFRTAEAFTAELRVKCDFQKLYDQAGIMVRIDAEHWVKAGIEFSDGRAMLSSVLTNGQSDWATAPYEHDAGDFWMRVTVAGGVLRLQASADGKIWPLVRLAPFTKAQSYRVGPMACTPERDGLPVTFTRFSLKPPLGKDLHDLS
jgi:regulation of enolase protein 1 (concanavalin A-like superfamily)